jgi:hypothetical protein
MKTKLCLAVAFTLVTATTFAQFYLEPFVGFQIDMVNKARFKMINTAVQGNYQFNKHAELFVRLQKSWPIENTTHESSYTANPSFPVYATAIKKAKPSGYSAAFGNRIRLNGANKHHVFSFMFFGGYSFQKIEVNYKYDKNIYTILNPDQTLKKGGFFVGGGFEYMRIIKNGRLLFQLNLASPPIVEKIKYPYSFTLMVPLSFNIGYSIMLKKRNNEK